MQWWDGRDAGQMQWRSGEIGGTARLIATLLAVVLLLALLLLRRRAALREPPLARRDVLVVQRKELRLQAPRQKDTARGGGGSPAPSAAGRAAVRDAATLGSVHPLGLFLFQKCPKNQSETFRVA